MSVLLSTRGYAKVNTDTINRTGNNGIGEAQTELRMCFPYGAASGWKVVYQGFSGPSTDDLTIYNAAVWILPPGGVRTAYPLTFSGVANVTIAADAWVESDAVNIACVPGTLVWVAQFYKNGTSAATGLPYCAQGYVRERTGTASNDGALAGAPGALTDQTQNFSGFDHTALGGPLNAGLSYLIRCYQPMTIIGSIHPSYTNVQYRPFRIGDSINIGDDDFNDDDTVWTFQYVGGRAAKDNYPFIVFGQGGSNAGGFTALVGGPLMNYLFGLGPTVVVNEYGVNDLRTRADAALGVNANLCWLASRKAVADSVAGAYGTPYLQTTMTPCSAQADMGSGVTIAAFTAERAIFNDRVRSSSLTLANSIGYIDVCQLVETDPVNNSNVWVTGTA